MRLPLFFGLAMASFSLGCMAAPKQGAPPPNDPTVLVAKEKAPADTAEEKEAEKQKILEALTKSDKKVENDVLMQSSGDAFGEGGLGLVGTGPGGGGGGGIGLGGIGTLGHGSGTGSGQGYGSGAGSFGGGGSGKKGRVQAATATTSGAGLPPEVIQRIVRAKIGQIQACYEAAMAKAPALAGKVAVKFIIDGQGSVSSASAADTNITDADMVSCVIGAVKKMSFPAPDGGSPIVVTYPFNFSSGDN